MEKKYVEWNHIWYVQWNILLLLYCTQQILQKKSFCPYGKNNMYNLLKCYKTKHYLNLDYWQKKERALELICNLAWGHKNILKKYLSLRILLISMVTPIRIFWIDISSQVVFNIPRLIVSMAQWPEHTILHKYVFVWLLNLYCITCLKDWLTFKFNYIWTI